MRVLLPALITTLIVLSGCSVEPSTSENERIALLLDSITLLTDSIDDLNTYFQFNTLGPVVRTSSNEVKLGDTLFLEVYNAAGRTRDMFAAQNLLATSAVLESTGKSLLELEEYNGIRWFYYVIPTKLGPDSISGITSVPDLKYVEPIENTFSVSFEVVP